MQHDGLPFLNSEVCLQCSKRVRSGLLNSANDLLRDETYNLVSNTVDPNMIRSFRVERSWDFSHMALDKFHANLIQFVQQYERLPYMLFTTMSYDIEDRFGVLTQRSRLSDSAKPSLGI